MRGRGEFVEGGSAEIVFFGDIFGGDTHGSETVHDLLRIFTMLNGIPIDFGWKLFVEFVHGISAHAFDACSNADVDGAALYRVGYVGNGLKS